MKNKRLPSTPKDPSLTGKQTSTRDWKVIKSSPQTIYHAFTDPAALAVWMAPGEMTGKVHRFDLQVGGGYQMSLFYPPAQKASPGKTSEKEDRFTARFLELSPPHKIVQAINFDSNEAAFSGEMMMEVLLAAKDKATRVTILFKHIPSGIRLVDNKAGTRSTLQKLARYVE